jgi:uncharacterized repeat protein (TIGR03803 family)
MAFLAALPFAGAARGAALPQARSRWLYAFSDNGRQSPWSPEAGVIRAADGFLYGTTEWGGESGAGTVYRMSAPREIEVLCSFGVRGQGARPQAKVLQATDGLLYGTTSYDNGPPSTGTIFRVSIAGDFETLHVFTGSDGADCFAPLIQATDGRLYGTCWGGGAFNAGCIFSIGLDGTFELVHSLVFDTEGGQAYAGLVQGSDGQLYGAASRGGRNDRGTIFTLSLDGNFHVLHVFSGADGANPRAELVQGPDGLFYGTTTYGGAVEDGTIFRLSPQGKHELIWSFDRNGPIGALPSSPLLFATDGHCYGAVGNGFVGPNSVFRLERDGTPRVLQSYPANWPQTGDLLEFDGSLVGVMEMGGARGGGGIYEVFKGAGG